MVRYEIKGTAEGGIGVSLDGDLVIGPDAANIRDCLKPLVEKFPDVTVDLSRLRRIDSTGIGVLVMTHAIAAASGNRMRVVNVSGSVREVLLLVRLMPILADDSENPVAA